MEIDTDGHIGPDKTAPYIHKILIVNNTLVVILFLCNALVVHEGHLGPVEAVPYNHKILIVDNALVVSYLRKSILCNILVVQQ